MINKGKHDNIYIDYRILLVIYTAINYLRLPATVVQSNPL